MKMITAKRMKNKALAAITKDDRLMSSRQRSEFREALREIKSRANGAGFNTFFYFHFNPEITVKKLRERGFEVIIHKEKDHIIPVYEYRVFW